VELLVLVDRRFNRHLPIQPDYVGLHVDALDEAYVKVRWLEKHGKDEILLFEFRPDA
jgi:pyrimidine operon attenuation protein/uracil phosphoribosyltransferase